MSGAEHARAVFVNQRRRKMRSAMANETTATPAVMSL
jgi:hypothetical protein